MNKTFKKNETIMMRKEETEYLVYNDLDGRIRILNLTAGRILELCDGNYTVDQIVDKLAEEFEDVVRDQCRQDVLDCIRELADKGIVSETS